MKIWVNGTFDVLHRGHVELLKYASGFGDVYMGIDYDERVKEFKGDSRPVNTFEDRREILKSLKYVKDVQGFGSDSELIKLIETSGAKTMIIGSDYEGKKIIGSHLFDRIIYFSRIKKYSSTKIIEHEKDISNR